MKFLVRNPFLRLLIPWVLGQICFEYLPQCLFLMVAVFLMAILLLIWRFHSWFTGIASDFNRRWEFGFFVHILIFVLAWFSSFFTMAKKLTHPTDIKVYVAEIIDEPIKTDRQLKFVALVCFEKAKQKVLLILPPDSVSEQLKLHAGDLVLFRAQLKQPPAKVNPSSFDERKYLYRKGVYLKADIKKAELRKLSESNSNLNKIAGKFRSILIGKYSESGIKDQNLAVLTALSLGQKSALDYSIRSDFSAAGAMHVLAVSGLHVGVIYLIFSGLIGVLLKNKSLAWLKALMVVLMLWMYAFITGLSPSVNRASTMCSLVAIGSVFSQKTQIYNTLSLTSFVLLFFNPKVLYDVGFQLSFAAVIGIVYFQPLLKKTYEPTTKIYKWMWELVIVSVAAQIGTLPFSLYYFGQFPVYFLLTNFMVIPLTTFVLYLSFALLFLSSIPGITHFLGLILNKTLDLMLDAVQSVSHFPYAVIHYKTLGIQSFLMFLIVLVVSFWVAKRTYNALVIGLICIVLFFCVDLYRLEKEYDSNQFIVYSDFRNSTIEFVNNGCSRIFVSNVPVGDVFKRHQDNLVTKFQYDTVSENQFLNFGSKRIVILRESNKSGCRLQKSRSNFNKTNQQASKSEFNLMKPIEIELLVFAKGIDYSSVCFLEFSKPKICVIESSIPIWLVREIENKCKTLHIKTHNCRNDGAFIQKIFSNFVVI